MTTTQVPPLPGGGSAPDPRLRVTRAGPPVVRVTDDDVLREGIAAGDFVLLEPLADGDDPAARRRAADGGALSVVRPDGLVRHRRVLPRKDERPDPDLPATSVLLRCTGRADEAVDLGAPEVRVLGRVVGVLHKFRDGATACPTGAARAAEPAPPPWNGDDARAPAILHVDLDAFYVSAERVRDPSLVGRPVIVGGHPGDRGVVASASYEARRCGVRSAMPLRRAHGLCPDAVFLRGDHGWYAELSERVFAVFDAFTPRVHGMGLDEAYLDLSGSERLLRRVLPERFGIPVPAGPRWVRAAAAALRAEVLRRTGLPISIGAAGSRTAAKVASDLAKPSGLLLVEPGREAGFLAPLEVGAIPGVGDSTRDSLRRLNIRTVGDLAAIPPETLEAVLGEHGASLAARARGRDAGAWTAAFDAPREQRKSISRDTTLQRETGDREVLLGLLHRLTARAARTLRAEDLSARTVTVRVRYADFSQRQGSRTLPAADWRDDRFFAEVRALFARLHVKRMRVRLVGVTLSGLRPGAARQGELFEDRAGRSWSRVLGALDRIRDRHGHDAVLAGPSIRAVLRP